MCVVTLQARPQDLAGGGCQEFFFRLEREVRGHAPPRTVFKMVQFGALWRIF